MSSNPEEEALNLGAISRSEVVALSDESSTALLVRTLPATTNVNISHSSRVHIGHNFVTITQRVDNTELHARRKLILISPPSDKATRRCRRVVVCGCWAFVVALGFGLYLSYLQIDNGVQYDRLNIGLNETWYRTRAFWQAMPPYGVELLNLPLKNVVIGHSGLGSERCYEQFDCIKILLGEQQYSLSMGLPDIIPNFLVGGEGIVFEGRGANVQGDMVKSWDANTISIMLIGDYSSVEPDLLQLQHINILLKQLVKEGVVIENFVLLSQCLLFHDDTLLSPIVLRLNESLLQYLQVAESQVRCKL